MTNDSQSYSIIGIPIQHTAPQGMSDTHNESGGRSGPLYHASLV